MQQYSTEAEQHNSSPAQQHSSKKAGQQHSSILAAVEKIINGKSALQHRNTASKLLHEQTQDCSTAAQQHSNTYFRSSAAQKHCSRAAHQYISEATAAGLQDSRNYNDKPSSSNCFS